MKIIVTDHHKPSDTLPPAHAVVNPNRKDCDFPFKHLAGVGVVFYLIIALRARLKEKGCFFIDQRVPNLKNYLDLVAVGTISDIVPLYGDNRILVSIGLDVLKNTCRPGLKALMSVANLSQNSQLTAGDVAYRLGPRLNAAGRMDHASLATRLLLTTDPYEAKDLALKLDQLNNQRQSQEEKTFQEAIRMVDKKGLWPRSCTITLHSPHWHRGVIGIVASRLVERFYRPVMIITHNKDIAHGSGRSIDYLDLYEVLNQCREHIIRYGGHKAAAGVTLLPSHIHAFAEKFESIASSLLLKDDLVPRLRVDAVVRFKDINQGLLHQLEKLAPFGAGNPEPVLVSRNLAISNATIIKEKHLKLWAEQDGVRIEGIGFNMAHLKPDTTKQVSVAFSPKMEFYQGYRVLQLRLKDVGL